MDLINQLKDLNFSEAEAKVYTTCLSHGQATGYEISKYSGIARSKIYNHLETLVKRGVLESFSGDKATYYRAISPEDLVLLTRKKVDASLEKFSYLAKNMPVYGPDDGIWEIEDYQRVGLKALEIVKGAKESLYIQVWQEDLDQELEDAINEKIDSLDQVLVILYDQTKQYKTGLKKFYRHGFEMERLEDMSQRWVTVVADDRSFLYSGLLFNGQAQGIYAENKILAFFAKEYVQHDAYSLKLIEDFREEIVARYGENMKGIRDIFK